MDVIHHDRETGAMIFIDLAHSSTIQGLRPIEKKGWLSRLLCAGTLCKRITGAK